MNSRLADLAQKLRRREHEVIKRWDMDDIDLVTERLQFLITGKEHPTHNERIAKASKQLRKRFRIPKLDLKRVTKLQQEENEEYESEEEESETQHFHSKNGFASTESAERKTELQSRKDKIIGNCFSCLSVKITGIMSK